MKLDQLRSIQVGDLLHIASSTVIWDGLEKDPAGFRHLVGHQNVERDLWCTVVDIELELNFDSSSHAHEHYTKVWLHKPIWGSYTASIVTFGWLWTSACHRAITLHKS